MIELLGWFATILVLVGFILNSLKHHKSAIIIWILGDLIWIAYDTCRGIYPHLFLSAIIIVINVIGYYKNKS